MLVVSICKYIVSTCITLYRGKSSGGGGGGQKKPFLKKIFNKFFLIFILVRNWYCFPLGGEIAQGTKSFMERKFLPFHKSREGSVIA